MNMTRDKNEIKILAPCGILGYGYPRQSFFTDRWNMEKR